MDARFAAKADGRGSGGTRMGRGSRRKRMSAVRVERGWGAVWADADEARFGPMRMGRGPGRCEWGAVWADADGARSGPTRMRADSRRKRMGAIRARSGWGADHAGAIEIAATTSRCPPSRTPTANPERGFLRERPRGSERRMIHRRDRRISSARSGGRLRARERRPRMAGEILRSAPGFSRAVRARAAPPSGNQARARVSAARASGRQPGWPPARPGRRAAPSSRPTSIRAAR
jgi:hypothetical protein